MKQEQLSLGLDAPVTLKDARRSKVRGRVVNLTTGQLKKQGSRVRAPKEDTPGAVQLGFGIVSDEYTPTGSGSLSTATVVKRDAPKADAPKADAPRKTVSEQIETENERMTHRQSMEQQHGKNKTVRTGSSVRVLNRIALYETGHAMNGGGTRKEVKQAASWQSEFPINKRGSSLASTSYDNRDHTQNKESK